MQSKSGLVRSSLCTRGHDPYGSTYTAMNVRKTVLADSRNSNSLGFHRSRKQTANHITNRTNARPVFAVNHVDRHSNPAVHAFLRCIRIQTKTPRYPRDSYGRKVRSRGVVLLLHSTFPIFPTRPLAYIFRFPVAVVSRRDTGLCTFLIIIVFVCPRIYYYNYNKTNASRSI
jgi:hypothetical protein